MKRVFFTPYHSMVKYFLVSTLLIVCLTGCLKHGPDFDDWKTSPGAYSSDVIDKWITLQLRLMRDATGIPNNLFARPYAYTGIVALEALRPGLEINICDLTWNGLGDLPQVEKHKKYYWPASVNSGLAFINKSMFPAASLIDKAAIDSLEAAINASFSGVNSEVLSRSNDFGTAIGMAIFNWSETDGYKNASLPYTPPVGFGFWVPTPPAFAPAATPYFGNDRTIISGSGDNTQPGPPIAYSETVNSPFYNEAKQVYDVSQTLTTDQKNWALFWRDIPGVSSPGHWESILQQVLNITHSRLDKAAASYALTGTVLLDAVINVWKTKYTYNQVRPITYIRNVLGFTTWNSLLTTPAHPEYSSAHAVISAASADAFQFLFGDIGSFTDHTYDYMGFPARTFATFKDIGVDAGNSRLYAGIHYQPSIDAGLDQGRKVTANILRSIVHGKGIEK